MQDLDRKFIEKNQHRVSFVYADKDEWVPRKHVEGLVRSYPEIDAVIVPKTLHVFTFSERMTDDFVHVICKTLDKFKKSQDTVSD